MTSTHKQAGQTGPGRNTISVCSWNVNNRVGQTTFRPEAFAAAMETGADVLVFNEFFPKDALNAFQQALTLGGWLYQAISVQGAVKANRVLIASRFPVVVRSLPPSAVDEHLLTNALCIDIGELRMLAIRVPAYKRTQERKDAWTWLAGIADEMRVVGRPSMIVGDLNTAMASTGASRVEQFHALMANGWSRAQPKGLGSFAGARGWSEIDHILATGTCRISNAKHVSTTDSFDLAGTPTSLSDHTPLVFEATARGETPPAG